MTCTCRGPQIADALFALRTIYGLNVTVPKEAIITKWGQDPFARGATSYFPNGTTPEDMDQLAVPENNLFFAGGWPGACLAALCLTLPALHHLMLRCHCSAEGASLVCTAPATKHPGSRGLEVPWLGHGRQRAHIAPPCACGACIAALLDVHAGHACT